MSSSSDLATDPAPGAAPRPLATPELRSGAWTRFGDRAVLGDVVTEQVLGGLAESTRAAARAQGYATGWAEGRREAAAEAATQRAELEQVAAAAEAARQAEHVAALVALGRAAQALQDQAAQVAAELEAHVVALAREVAEAVVGHELSTAADPAGEVVRRALAVLPQELPVTVRVAPATAADPALERLREHGVHVVADPALGAHDALVETTAEAVDLRVGAALARVREVLS